MLAMTELYNTWQTKTGSAQRDFQHKLTTMVRVLAKHFSAETAAPIITSTADQRAALFRAYFDQDPKYFTTPMYLHA